MRRQSMLQQSAVGPVAIGIERDGPRMASRPITRRVDVGRTAWKHEPVQLRRLPSEMGFALAERDVYRVAARAPHGAEVMVELQHVPCAFLFTSAPGNADAGAWLGSRGHHGRKIVAL